jgi:anti-sigma B factor antagonist
MAPAQPDPRIRKLSDGLLTIEVGPQHETCLMRVTGELDLSSAATFERELHRVLADGQLKSVILDLADLEFIDSSGLQSLVRLTRWSRQDGDHLRVIPPEGEADAVLRLSGIRDLLPLIQ